MKQVLKLMLTVMSMVLALSLAVPLAASAEMVKKVDNFIIFMDQSGSMAYAKAAAGNQKFDQAVKAVTRFDQMTPELGYSSALALFAPFKTVSGPAIYKSGSLGSAASRVVPTFNQMTTMGDGLTLLSPVIEKLSGKTALILFTDGRSNEGSDLVADAKALYSKNVSNLCIHVVNYADTPEGQKTIDAIRALSGCSVTAYAKSLESDAAMARFVKEVLYDEVYPAPAPAPAPVVVAPLDEDGQLQEDGFYKKTVSYGTTRRDLCETVSIEEQKNCSLNLKRLDTGNEETKTIQYGRVTVKIPFTKERGSTDGMRLINLDHGIDWDAFISNLTSDDLLVFIHGYNTSFSDAAIRCAQLAHDTNFEGEAVLFSWPSKKSIEPIFNYRKDKARAEENFDFLADFLQKLAGNTDKKIHLIAHSMGTYLLMNALVALDTRIDTDDTILRARRSASDGKIFSQIILAAPDIGRGAYMENFNKHDLSAIAERITLYSSINDVVLKGSRLINKFVEGTFQVRLGDSSRGFTVIRGMDTIDTRQEIKPQIIGHSFYAAYPSIVTDMHILLRYETPPDGRILQKVSDEDNNILWFIIDDRRN